MTYKNHSRIAPVDLKVLAGRFENFSRFEPFDFSEHQFQLQRVEFIGPRACPTFPKPPWTRNTLSNKSVRPTLLYIPEGYTRGTCIGILHQFFHQQNLEFSGKAVTKCCLNIIFARNQYRIFCQEGSILFCNLYIYFVCISFLFIFCFHLLLFRLMFRRHLSAVS